MVKQNLQLTLSKFVFVNRTGDFYIWFSKTMQVMLGESSGMVCPQKTFNFSSDIAFQMIFG